MNYFVCKMLNNALEQVKSTDDARALAEAIIDLSGNEEADCIWKHTERIILTALIEETFKKGGKQNFSNVIAIMHGDFESALNGNGNWLELKESTTKRMRESALMGLEARLCYLRQWSKVS